MFCKYNRWKLAEVLSQEAPLSRRLKRHLQTCDTCRSFYEFQQEMTERLRRDAVMAQPELPDALKQEIMNAIVPGNPISARYDYSPQTVRHRRWILAAASVGLVLLGSILLWLNQRGQSNAPILDKPPVMVRNMNPWTAVDSFTKNLGAEEGLSNWSELMDKPMRQEWETLQADAESAVKFLVSCVDVNFQPVERKKG
jgi:hypothetical protein